MRKEKMTKNEATFPSGFTHFSNPPQKASFSLGFRSKEQKILALASVEEESTLSKIVTFLVLRSYNGFLKDTTKKLFTHY